MIVAGSKIPNAPQNGSLLLFLMHLELRKEVWTKSGHILNLTSFGKANMAGPTNSETEINCIGWSEHKHSYLKVGHGD